MHPRRRPASRLIVVVLDIERASDIGWLGATDQATGYLILPSLFRSGPRNNATGRVAQMPDGAIEPARFHHLRSDPDATCFMPLRLFRVCERPLQPREIRAGALQRRFYRGFHCLNQCIRGSRFGSGL